LIRKEFGWEAKPQQQQQGAHNSYIIRCWDTHIQQLNRSSWPRLGRVCVRLSVLERKDFFLDVGCCLVEIYSSVEFGCCCSLSAYRHWHQSKIICKWYTSLEKK
jgi:hypothetical protein